VLPELPLVQVDFCPFEYGCSFDTQWKAQSGLRVYPAKGDTTEVAFVIEPDTEFTAHSADMVTSQIGIVVAKGPLQAYVWRQRKLESGVYVRDVEIEEDTLSFDKGDSLYVLSYAGEGIYSIWQKGKVWQVEGFWKGKDIGPNTRAFLQKPGIETWWVWISLSDGRQGWLALRNTVQNGISFAERIDYGNPKR
jgi:hypothetical protein